MVINMLEVPIVQGQLKCATWRHLSIGDRTWMPGFQSKIQMGGERLLQEMICVLEKTSLLAPWKYKAVNEVYALIQQVNE